MRTKQLLIVGLCLFALSFRPAHARTENPVKPSIKLLEPFIGEWTIHATWTGGEALVARNINAWMVGGAHLSDQTFVGEAGKAYQRYQTIMSYDQKLGCLVSYSFAFDGKVSVVRVDTEDGKTFKFGFTPLDEHESNVRQTITFDGPDTYRWVVEIRSQENQWTQIMDGTWKRSAPNTTSPSEKS